MQLAEAIYNLPQLQALSTAQQILDWFNTVIPSQPDHTLYSIREFDDLFDEDLDKIRLVLGTLQTAALADPAVAGYYDTLKTVGLDFSASSLQSMLTQLAVSGKWSPEILTALRSLGVIPGVPHWQSIGIQKQPTIDAIQRVVLHRAIGVVVNQIQVKVESGALTTVAEIAAAAASAFATQQANMGG